MAETRPPHRLPPVLLRWRSAYIRARVRRAMRRHGTTFLTNFLAAAEEAEMQPFLLWGTLLGAVREGGFIEGDRDLDAGILYPDYARRDRLVEAMARRGHRLERSWDYKLRFAGPVHGLHLDLDVFYPFGDEMISTTPDPDGGLSGSRFPAHMLAAFRQMRILGGMVTVTVPDPPEPLLEAIYGRGWKTPDPAYDSSTDLNNRFHLGPGEARPPFPAG